MNTVVSCEDENSCRQEPKAEKRSFFRNVGISPYTLVYATLFFTYYSTHFGTAYHHQTCVSSFLTAFILYKIVKIHRLQLGTKLQIEDIVE